MEQNCYRFSLHFEGKELAGHLMNAEDFANSLIGISCALRQISSFSDAERGTSLKLQTKLRDGSVISDLVFTVSAGYSLFQGQDILGTAKEIVEFFSLLLKLKQKHGENISPQTVNMEFNNCQIGQVAHTICSDKDFWNSSKQFCAPLAKGCAEAIKIEDMNGKVILGVSKEGYLKIAAPIKEQQGETMKQKLWVTIDGPRLESNQSWNFQSSEMGAFKAKMSDQKFLERVRKGEIFFGHGDQLLVELEIQQGATLTFSVINVFEHRRLHSPLQRSFEE